MATDVLGNRLADFEVYGHREHATPTLFVAKLPACTREEAEQSVRSMMHGGEWHELRLFNTEQWEVYRLLRNGYSRRSTTHGATWTFPPKCDRYMRISGVNA